ncbi:MAG TPA: tetratricopeptide repeat protein [Terriglobales bacterium]|nr:tetratricopeptide repeat protein [Terriglobales bacterium]
MDTNRQLRRILGGVLLAAASLYAQTSSSKTIRDHRVAAPEQSLMPELTQAEAAVEKKDYAAAEPLLKKVVEAQPANYQAWFDLGFVYNALGRNQDSIDAYRHSVDAKHDIFESNLNLGLSLAKNKQPGAEEFLRAATKLKPQNHVDEGQARAWLGLGHLLAESDPDGAVGAYREAAALQPKDPEPRLSAGLLLEKANKFADAEEQYKQALALDPSSQDALVGLANVYMRGQRFPEAEEYLRKVVSQRPNEAAPHIQLGRVLAADQKYDEAAAELQAGLKIAPSDVGAQSDLADVHTESGKFAEAETVLRTLLSSDGQNAELHQKLGQALMKQKKFPAAQQEFMNAVKLKPDWGAAYGDLAVAANEAQNYALAIQALDMRAKFLPEIPVGYFLRATAYDHLRDFHQAAANYHLFLQVANGKYPDQEWQARHRLITIEPKK